jgi:hypothetical protein
MNRHMRLVLSAAIAACLVPGLALAQDDDSAQTTAPPAASKAPAKPSTANTKNL